MNFIKPCIWERKKNHFLFHALGLKNYLNRYGGHSNKSAVCTFFSKRVFLSHHKKMRNWYKKSCDEMCYEYFMFSKGHICTLNRPSEPKMHKLHKNKSLNQTNLQYNIYTWTKCANLCYKRPIKLENICSPWEKFQNLISVGPLIRL